jgi:hypothetical protein
MWQYVSHSLDSINIAGMHIVRVFMKKESTDECFFLRYQALPNDSVIILHANSVIQMKNDYEQQEGGLE